MPRNCICFPTGFQTAILRVSLSEELTPYCLYAFFWCPRSSVGIAALLCRWQTAGGGSIPHWWPAERQKGADKKNACVHSSGRVLPTTFCIDVWTDLSDTECTLTWHVRFATSPIETADCTIFYNFSLCCSPKRFANSLPWRQFSSSQIQFFSSSVSLHTSDSRLSSPVAWPACTCCGDPFASLIAASML